MTYISTGSLWVKHITGMQKENGEDRLSVHFEDEYEDAILILIYYSSEGFW
jgi:hypothetical protein